MNKKALEHVFENRLSIYRPTTLQCSPGNFSLNSHPHPSSPTANLVGTTTLHSRNRPLTRIPPSASTNRKGANRRVIVSVPTPHAKASRRHYVWTQIKRRFKQRVPVHLQNESNARHAVGGLARTVWLTSRGRKRPCSWIGDPRTHRGMD